MSAAVTVGDLSPDQRVAYDSIMRWRESRGTDLLTLGGYAGCLSGNTSLMYGRGARNGVRPITLHDLYLKFNGHVVPGVRGISNRWVDLTVPTFLYALWPDETVEWNRIVAVYESGVKPVMRITFDKDRQLVCTAEHPIATPGGEFVAAGDLAVGGSALARSTWRLEDGKGRRADARPPRIIVNTKYHLTGSYKAVVCNGITYEYMRVARARLVVEAAMNDLPYDEFVHALKHNAGVSAEFRYLPSNVDVHHEDEDTLNDDISNLKVLPAGEHTRLHTVERNKELDRPEPAKILKIEQLGEEMTYDIQMESPANNFVADGIIVHNSGKSTLVSLVAEQINLPAFCAYTGKAASVLRRKLAVAGTATVGAQPRNKEGLPSSDPRPYCGTIHSLIYRPCDCRTPREVPVQKPCPEKVCIAELGWTGEAAVCGAGHRAPKMTEKAFKALKPQTKLVYAAKDADGRCRLCGGKEWLRREILDRRYNLIIVDEASMVDDTMLRDLKSYGVPILAVGDHGQLPPVGGTGSLMKAPHLRLERIHRQAEGNPIIALSKYIRENGGFPESFPDSEHVRFGRLRDVERLIEERYADATPERLLEMGVACYTNRRRLGLNTMVRRVRGFVRAGAGNGLLPQKGEHVVCLRNMKSLDGASPIANGMRGVLAADTSWKLIKDPHGELTDDAGEPCRESDIHLVGSIGFPEDEIEARDYTMLARQFNREKTFSTPEELVREVGIHSFAMAGALFDFGYAMTVHKCVAPDTLVETPAGLVRASELAPTGTIATPASRATYRGLVRNARRSMLELTTDDGYTLRVTPDHGIDLWSAEDGYVRREAKDARPGDIVRLRLGAEFKTGAGMKLPSARPQDVRAKKFALPKTCTKAVAEFLGLMVADGTVYTKGFRLAKRHKDVADRFDTLCRELFGATPSRFFTLGAHHVEVSSALIAAWLRDVGGMNPNDKRVPECVLVAPLNVQARFLRGLFEDGTVNVKDGRLDHVEFTSTVPEVRRIVRTMLLRFGIVAGAVDSKPSLYIYGRYAKRFGTSIGFVSRFKQARLESSRVPEGTQYVFPLRHDELHLSVAGRGVVQRHRAPRKSFADRAPFHHSTVRSVTRYAGESVCVEVPDGHQFVQDGFCGWNCQGSQFDDFVVVAERPGPVSNEDYARWAYTACTRSAKVLTVLR